MHWAWFFFFFSSRRRHTRCSRDWSSDVCSSDLVAPEVLRLFAALRGVKQHFIPLDIHPDHRHLWAATRVKRYNVPIRLILQPLLHRIRQSDGHGFSLLAEDLDPTLVLDP